MQARQSTKQSNIRQWLSGLILMALIFSALPRTMQARGLANRLDRATAQEEAVALVLGEYVQREATEGDLFTYAIYLSEDGDYMVRLM